mgnify:CR=1 FL=1
MWWCTIQRAEISTKNIDYSCGLAFVTQAQRDPFNRYELSREWTILRDYGHSPLKIQTCLVLVRNLIQPMEVSSLAKDPRSSSSLHLRPFAGDPHKRKHWKYFVSLGLFGLFSQISQWVIRHYSERMSHELIIISEGNMRLYIQREDQVDSSYR